MFKNTASQKLIVYAFDSTNHLPKTGDAANITAYVNIDFAGTNVLADTSATEISSSNAAGYYQFDLAQAETNGDTLLFSAKSVTANIVVTAVPAVVYTRPAAFGLTAGAAGGLFIAGTNAPVTITGSGNALTLTSTGGNGSGLSATGNGTGCGVKGTSGSGATGDGICGTAASTNGNGIRATGTGTGNGLRGEGVSGDGIFGTATVSGHGIRGIGVGTAKHGIVGTGSASNNSAGIAALGAATSDNFGLYVKGGLTSGDAVRIETVSGHGVFATGTGTNKYGIYANSASSHGMYLNGASSGLDVSSLGTTFLAAINVQVVDGLTVDQLTNSKAAVGADPTLAQAVYAIHQFLVASSISGTTVTVKDNAGNPWETFTINSSTAPTSITRAT